MCVPYWWCTKHAQLIMGTWSIYKKTLPTTDLNKKTLSFDKISPRDFFFFPFFSICTCQQWFWVFTWEQLHIRSAHKLFPQHVFGDCTSEIITTSHRSQWVNHSLSYLHDIIINQFCFSHSFTIVQGTINEQWHIHTQKYKYVHYGKNELSVTYLRLRFVY